MAESTYIGAFDRAGAVARLRADFQQRKTDAWAAATREGWAPVGGFGEDGGFELMAMDRNQVYVYATDNAMAALSTSADLARLVPGGLDGDGITLGIWDQGAALASHVELAGRTTVRDGSYPVNHATHAAGTLGASGLDPEAKGMAPRADIDSYDWSDDLAEMAGRAMSTPGESGTIQISSHSYGYLSGWAPQYSPPRWYGRIEEGQGLNFGLYDRYASRWDDLCYQAPYYLPFKSAGNNRLDDAPAEGVSFKYYDHGWITKTYDPTTDPAGDGHVEGGYDTIPILGNAKNVMTVGAVYDATEGGLRSPAAAAMTSYSGWGPTDDGRVKPDVVANGSLLYSSSSAGDHAYAYMSGTSMATPNAAGSAALILEHYGNLFPGKHLKASTLKGLIIHTANDLGEPGPDYIYGWGLMNTRGAVDVVSYHSDYPEAGTLREAALQSGNTNRYTFTWDGEGAIKVTACWTDPAGEETYELDNRASRLVNDLDLRVIDPQGRIHYPYRLDPEHPARAAGRGDNLVDNVEQVLVDAAGGPGEYVVEMTAKNALVDGKQDYALIVSGLDALDTPPTLVLKDTIDGADDGDGLVTLYGTVSMPVPAICALQVQYSLDAGATWVAAELAGASVSGEALRVDHDYTAQVRDLAIDGEVTFSVDWNSYGGRSPIAFSPSTLVRIRALNGSAASGWQVSPVFLVDNEGPDVGQAQFVQRDLAFGRYVLEGAVSFAWSEITDDGAGVAGFLYAADNDDPHGATFTTRSDATVYGLSNGREHTIFVWAIDGAGNLSAPLTFDILVVAPDGAWDGVSEPDFVDEMEAHAEGETSRPLAIQMDRVNGMQILRWPFKYGSEYEVQYCTDLGGKDGWNKWNDARFTLDQDGWVVWVQENTAETEANGLCFFRVVRRDLGRFHNAKPRDRYAKPGLNPSGTSSKAG